jgi:hypothetical protein
MKPVVNEVYSLSSFSSASMNRSSVYTSKQGSSFSPLPSTANSSPMTFPFPPVKEVDEKPRLPNRRRGKLGLLGKLISGSRRNLMSSKKSLKEVGREMKASSTQHSKKTASSTTMNLSKDAAQVFSTLRRHQSTGSPRRGLVRQKSEDSMIGSVLEFPSSGSSNFAESAEEVAVLPPMTQTRPKLPKKKAASFRLPNRSMALTRSSSIRSATLQIERTPPRAPKRSVRVPIVSPQMSPESSPRAAAPNTLTRSVEISPGNFQVLRGHQETLEYVRKDEVASTTCLFCSDTIYAINDAAMTVCPTCRCITPMHADGDGLALGFSAHEWLEIQREALAMR